MTGQQVSQILWVGEHPNAASLPGLAASNLAIIALDQVHAALAYLAAGHRVDGVLLDLTTSATEGLNSFQALQTQAPDLPMIVLVSPAQIALGLEAIRAGAEDYLIKGQTPIAELWRAVGCALERHRRQQAIAPTHFPKNDLDTVARQNQRYQKIFQEVPVSLWEEDWSAVTALIRDLQRQGITDFATYIDQHPEFVTLAMQRVQILDVNQATLDIFKAQTKADILGSLEAVFSTVDTLPGFKTKLMAFCLGKPTFEKEMARRTVTGELIYVWVKTTFPDWRSGASRVLVSLLDISKRVQLEAERRQAEDRLHQQATLLINAERIGQMGSWSADIPNNRLIWSRGTYRLFGLPPNHRIENLERFLERVVPEDRPKLLAAQHRAEQSTGIVNAEYRIRRPNGEIRWLAERGNVEYDAAGRPLRRSGMVMDVTDQKAAEATLRASEERFRLVSRATSDAIWDRDIVANTTWRGEGFKTLFGYSDADLQAPNNWWHSLLHPDDRLRVLASIQTALDGKASSWKDEYRFRCRDGSYAYVMNRGYIIRNTQGQAMRMIGGILDLTEKKNLEAQLLQSQKMEAIGHLTGGMAHDFNNLLTVIMGNAELLAEQLDSHPQMRSLADMIGIAAQRGADLTQRLLVFARRQTLDPQPVDVNQLVAHMDGLLRRTLGEQIEICCDYDNRLWPALADATQLESALLNLCINARDAMGGVGCLTLTTAQVHIAPEGGDRQSNLHPGDYVMVAVSDTGVGMAADLLSRAFEPFFTTKETGKGTGLGLSMVYSFVCQSNGHITIDSQPGVGTTVQLYLPRCSDRQRPALGGDQPPAAIINGGDSELILLVEDNALVRDYARQQLESLGYRVLVAENGPAALEMLQQQPDIDLLFTDVVMPGGLNGRELADAAHRLLPQLRVLYTSGYTENALTHREGPEAEIQLLHKPYQRAELAHKIRQALTGGQP